MAGARTEAGPMGAVRTVGEADIHTRAVRMEAVGRVTQAVVAEGILVRGGQAAAGICSAGAAAGAAVDLAAVDRRGRRRWRGRVADDRRMAAVETAADMAAGTAVCVEGLRGRLADIRPALRAVGLTGDRVMVDTAGATVVVTQATVEPAMRTAVTAAERVDLLTTTAETRAVTTVVLAGRGMAVLTAGTRMEILATGAAVMGRLRIAAILAMPG